MSRSNDSNMEKKKSEEENISIDKVNGEDEINAPARSDTDVQEQDQHLGLGGPSLMTLNSVNQQPGSQGLDSLQDGGRSNEAMDPLVSRDSGGHQSNLPGSGDFQ